MHPQISINTLCFPAASLGDHIERVARLGAKGISPVIDQIDAFGATETAKAVRDADLRIATITHLSFGYDTPAETATARERLLRTIEVASKVGAESVIMTTGGRGAHTWPEAAKLFAEAVAPCRDAARAAGVVLGIEGTSHLFANASIAQRLMDTVTLTDMADIAIMLDIFACWFDSDIEEAIAKAGPRLQLIQVSDYVYGDRSLPCRAVPGDGAIPFERLIPAIAATGFKGFYDIEVLGPRLPAEGEDAGLRRAAAYLGKILETL